MPPCSSRGITLQTAEGLLAYNFEGAKLVRMQLRATANKPQRELAHCWER